MNHGTRAALLLFLSFAYQSFGADTHEDAVEPVPDRALLVVPSGTGSSPGPETGTVPNTTGDASALPRPKIEDPEHRNRYPVVCSYRDDQYRNYRGCGRTVSEALEEAYRKCRARGNSYWNCFSGHCFGRNLAHRRWLQRIEGSDYDTWLSLVGRCPY